MSPCLWLNDVFDSVVYKLTDTESLEKERFISFVLIYVHLHLGSRLTYIIYFMTTSLAQRVTLWTLDDSSSTNFSVKDLV